MLFVEKNMACSTAFVRGRDGVVESVVYKLVRVEGNGTFVPATDKEVMEVKHMLEGCEKELCDIEGIQKQKEIKTTIPEQNPNLEVISAPPRNVDCKNLETDREQPVNDTDASKTSATEIKARCQPDFSLLKKEICLDSLTIRELQETFRAAFGRQTSVKDKVWLKRRITMGLTNSCHVPMTSYVLKEHRILKDKAPEVVQSQNGNCKRKPASRSTHHKHHSPSAEFKQEEDHPVLSGTKSGRTEMDSVAMDGDVHIEQIGAKRVRKPTKRYIEEEPDVDNDEWRSFSSRNDAHDHSSPKAKPRQSQKVANSTPFITRKDSLGGSVVQIPYVSRERRTRPRKEFLTLMDLPTIPKDDNLVIGADLLKNHVPGADLLKNHDPGADSLKNNGPDSVNVEQLRKSDAKLTSKDVIKRKHHRVWTLTEVTKLVEGVSRFGPGKWSEIKRLAFATHTYRTSVDLKDKWRNLLKASFSQGTTEKEFHQSRKNNNAAPIPAPILRRVRELAEMQKHSGIIFGHTKQVVEQKRSGFL